MSRWFYLVVFLSLTAGASETMRCGSRLIDNDSSQFKILDYCGEPTLKRNGAYKTYLRNRKGVIYGEVMVPTEQWIYDRGATEFRAILTFENGKLKNIEYESR